jgi:multiple sugar transport system ATP-binding protein
MATVDLEHVHKTYEGGFEAVRDFNLAIKEREFIVLVGPSGCGKSTTLRMIAGLEEITSGTISIGGKVMNKVPPKDRDIAMVFQSYALYPHMTAFENMAFALKLRKLPKDKIAEKVRRAADVLGMGAPSCASLSASCSTSRCRTWTPSCASRCARRSSAST